MSEIGDFKNMVSTMVSAQGKATTASASEPVSKAELWDAIHQYVSDYGDQFREPPTTGAGKRCDASRNELAETIDRLYRAAAPGREAAPLAIFELAKHSGAQTDWDTQVRNDPELSNDDFVFSRRDLERFAAALAQQGATQAPANKKGGGND